MNDQLNDMTLDPPGRIAIIGAGPLGLEAALYGRFLGYDITVFERGNVGQTLRDCVDQPLPMLPSTCLTSLAWSAINAQLGSGESALAETLPLTIGQWLRDGLERLARTDLLRGRILTDHEVVAIELVEVAADDTFAGDAIGNSDDGRKTVNDDDGFINEEDSFIDGDVPPDFRLIARSTDPDRTSSEQGAFVDAKHDGDDFEAVIFATGSADLTAIAGIDRCQSSPYFFRIGEGELSSADACDAAAAQHLRTGWREIVRIFASLGGRAELDLYRPIRL